MLNSTKGKIGKGKSFFEKAFGRDESEFYRLLYKPEAMIIYRLYFEGNGLEPSWWEAFSRLSAAKKEQLISIIGDNEFSNIESLTGDSELLAVLRYYTITRNDYEKQR